MTPADLLRPEVLSVGAYRLVEEAGAVKLNQNEAPYDVPAAFKEEVFARLRCRGWNRYAQEAPARVAALLAARACWPPEGIVLGAGSNLLLELAVFAAVRPGDRVAGPVPCFGLYRLLSTLAGAEFVEVPFGDMFAYEAARWVDTVRRAAPRLVFLCTPNNPTGSFMGREGVADVARAARGLVVVDEAYHEFAGENRRDVLEAFPHMVLCRTFSKAMAGAGIRLGYLVAHPDVAAELRKLVPPFNVNILTATAAEVLLEHPEFTARIAREACSERERVAAALARMEGVTVYPSRANFLLVATPRAATAAALASRGVLVRVPGGDGLEGMLRVNMGTASENDRFLEALAQVLAERE